MLKIYTALSVSPATKSDSPIFEGKHITMSFMAPSNTKALSSLKIIAAIETAGFLTIVDVVYWEKAKVTVAIPSVTRSLVEIKTLVEQAGHIYKGYKWLPHITIGYGKDQTEEYRHLVGQQIRLSDFYIKLKHFPFKGD